MVVADALPPALSSSSHEKRKKKIEKKIKKKRAAIYAGLRRILRCVACIDYYPANPGMVFVF